MKKRFASVAAVCLMLTVATAVHAQDKRMKAKRLFDRGVIALESQDYRNALDSFQAAYDTSPHWMVLAHIGTCYAKLGDPVQSIYALEKFLEDGGGDISTEERKSARKLLAEQHKEVGVLYLVVEPHGSEAKIDGNSIGYAPFDRILLRRGQHRIEVNIRGNTIERRISISAEQELTLRLPDKRTKTLTGNRRQLADTVPSAGVSQATDSELYLDEDAQSYGYDFSEKDLQQDKKRNRGVSVPFYIAVGLTGAGFLTSGIGGGLYWHYAASERNFSDKLGDPEWESLNWKDTCHSGELHTVENEAEQYFCETESTRRNYENLSAKALIPFIAGGSIVLVAGVASLVFYFNSHWFEKPADEPAVVFTPVLRDNFQGLMFSGRF